jgi:predicted ArsR family transcriptional regulator
VPEKLRIARGVESAENAPPAMLLPVFRDLIKPRWRTVLEELKRSGGMPVSELARKTGGSYMAVKAHCDELVAAGYLIRTRLPRTAVGRPEIFYSLATEADALFPQAGVDFTLDLLDEVKLMYGESAPDKLLFQYFQRRQEEFSKILGKIPTLEERATKLAKLREKDGCAGHCEIHPPQPVRIVEFHNPLQRVFERYPRAAAMELRMFEALLGAHITRTELPTGRESPPRIVFEIS